MANEHPTGRHSQKRNRFYLYGSGCPNYKHGQTGGRRRTPEYARWRSMVSRCTSPSRRKYADSRGITICDRWRESFLAFLEDMGPMPSPRFTIERIDNARGYSCGHCPDCLHRGEPANCRWASYKEQGRNGRHNHRITFDGATHCLSEWEEILGFPRGVLSTRLCQGWSEERALTQPVRKSPPRK